jgi:hypothetical protein
MSDEEKIARVQALVRGHVARRKRAEMAFWFAAMALPHLGLDGLDQLQQEIAACRVVWLSLVSEPCPLPGIDPTWRDDLYNYYTGMPAQPGAAAPQ